MQEIEIFNNDFGKPEVMMGEYMHQVLKRKGIKKVECSLSHSQNYITGMTIFCF